MKKNKRKNHKNRNLGLIPVPAQQDQTTSNTPLEKNEELENNSPTIAKEGNEQKSEAAFENHELNIALQAYIDGLESLRYSLDLAMKVSHLAGQKAHDEHSKFLNDVGELIEEKDGTRSYSIGMEHVRKVQKLQTEHKRRKNALKLLPRSFLSAFVAEYDALLGKLIKFVYTSKPEILDASERQITFAQLSAFGSLDGAKDYIINKEIESVLRKSHAEHFSWMENKFKIALKKDLHCWPTFIELTERRNLFVHADGIISEQYISVCKEHDCLQDGMSLGVPLSAPKDYLGRAFECLYELGVKLSFVLWRKFSPTECEIADQSLNQIAFSLIFEERYSLALAILEFADLELSRNSSDKFKKIFKINLAQCYKWLGKQDKCISCLDKADWSACSEDFQLCVAVLRNDFALAANIMRRIGKSETMLESSYEQWPVFREFRETSLFVNTFKDIFGREPTILEEVSSEVVVGIGTVLKKSNSNVQNQNDSAA